LGATRAILSQGRVDLEGLLSKGKLEARGSDESGWAKDRRAQFAWE
jgi:hypothetical protein